MHSLAKMKLIQTVQGVYGSMAFCDDGHVKILFWKFNKSSSVR